MKRIVEKRDGRLVKFNKDTILNSVVRAYRETYPNRGDAIAFDTARFVYQNNIRPWVVLQKERKIKTTELRRAVENGLMRQVPDVARKYIIYGYERDVYYGRDRVVLKEKPDIT